MVRLSEAQWVLCGKHDEQIFVVSAFLSRYLKEGNLTASRGSEAKQSYAGTAGPHASEFYPFALPLLVLVMAAILSALAQESKLSYTARHPYPEPHLKNF